MLTLKNTLNGFEQTQAVNFAIKEMQFDKLCKNHDSAVASCQIFWLEASKQATHLLSAFDEQDEFVGLLLANIYDCEKLVQNPESVDNTLFLLKDTTFDYVYEDYELKYQSANRDMFLPTKDQFDGEISFLVVDPEKRGKGVSSFLLDEFSKIAKDKTILFFGNDFYNCSFYEKNYFNKLQERNICFGDGKETNCYLYARQF